MDVLCLLVWAYSQFGIRNKWYMKYDHAKYADIAKICEYLGTDLCRNLPAAHSIIDCDTTSYFYNVGKVKVLKKLLKNNQSNFLSSLGRDGILTVPTLDYIETRIRIYKGLKTKSSLSLPPDPDSVVQMIKRAHLQTHTWLRSTEMNMNHLRYSDFGWSWSEEEKRVIPIWFIGERLPPKSVAMRKRKTFRGSSSEFADDEDDVQKTKKNRKRKLPYVGDTEGDVADDEAPEILTDMVSELRDGGEVDEQVNNIYGGYGNKESDESDWEIDDFESTDDSDGE